MVPFETAIHCLKTGNSKIRREKWTGSEYAFLLQPKEGMCSCNDIKVPQHRDFKINPIILKKTEVDFEFTQWIPSTEDILSDDWVIDTL
jgi:hypothetical protein